MNVHSFSVESAQGEKVDLGDYSGQVLLLVNVASKCGLTPQYEGLEALNRDFAGEGLQILGFPCNQFGGQEPGTNDEIQDFCSTNYSVSFPVLAKIDVNGEGADPLYSYLRAADPGDLTSANRFNEVIASREPSWAGTDAVKWNFTKFLIGRDGNVIKRYEPGVTPDEIRAELPEVLSA